jgi:hypothetical protein
VQALPRASLAALDIAFSLVFLTTGGLKGMSGLGHLLLSLLSGWKRSLDAQTHITEGMGKLER